MTSTPREAERSIGPVGAFLCRVAFLAICLPGPILLAADVSQAGKLSTQDTWGLLAGGVLTTIVGVGFGMFGFRVVNRSRRDARQLAAAGVAATAEILTVANHLGDEDPALKLCVRVSGPGFVAFEAETTRPVDVALVPGVVLGAVVDPSDRLFAIR
ncbi:hypothetical protein HDA40_006860 [Hamadaea flava]|uniref:Uncharacterized protein n=1 Tax=Hamadaea flava TaxID=1742688 RepID=A0ABV8LTI2_9ACTN|nr:hypothetical protein [Hamadaea flava]MCP2328353.1 hypothetical protein [Hamadaea flava]